MERDERGSGKCVEEIGETSRRYRKCVKEGAREIAGK